jgi:hypothetical protein
MFTIGIFTTHIPYVAFVVFYAFFFLFGIRDDATVSLQEREVTSLCELAVSDVGNARAGSCDTFHSDGYSGLLNFKAWFFFAQKKEKFLTHPDSPEISPSWLPNLFSRPPPFC